jgi:hypothetical protein
LAVNVVSLCKGNCCTWKLNVVVAHVESNSATGRQMWRNIILQIIDSTMMWWWRMDGWLPGMLFVADVCWHLAVG